MIAAIDTSPLLSLIKGFDTGMLNDDEWERLKEVDPSDEAALLKLFNKFIVPEYRVMDHRSQEMIKDNLEKVLSSSIFEFSEILNSVDMPFEPIENPKMFFSLLWFSLFETRFSN